MSHLKNQRFWNRIAARYAARPLKNVPAYEAMLADVASRLKGSDTVLEIGCGTGGTAIRLAPGVTQWTATDFSAEMIKIAKANLIMHEPQPVSGGGRAWVGFGRWPM